MRFFVPYQNMKPWDCLTGIQVCSKEHSRILPQNHETTNKEWKHQVPVKWLGGLKVNEIGPKTCFAHTAFPRPSRGVQWWFQRGFRGVWNRVVSEGFKGVWNRLVSEGFRGSESAWFQRVLRGVLEGSESVCFREVLEGSETVWF